jgi:4,4'-diapophytoene desaturase
MPTPELKTGSGIDWSDEALTQQIKVAQVIYQRPLEHTHK